MDVQEYFDTIEKRLSKNFDIEHDVHILNQHIRLFAKMEVHNEKYFGFKTVKVWRAENYEYCFVQPFDKIDEKKIEEFQQFLIHSIDQFVQPHSEHMSSVVTGVMVVNDFPPALVKKIENFKFRKLYAFSFKGWVDVRLIVVNLHSNRVISNRKGKEVQNYYLPVPVKSKSLVGLLKKQKF